MSGAGEGVRDGAGGLALDLSRGGVGGAGGGLCAVYEEVLSSARGVFEESERGGHNQQSLKNIESTCLSNHSYDVINNQSNRYPGNTYSWNSRFFNRGHCGRIVEEASQALSY